MKVQIQPDLMCRPLGPDTPSTGDPSSLDACPYVWEPLSNCEMAEAPCCPQLSLGTQAGCSALSEKAMCTYSHGRSQPHYAGPPTEGEVLLHTSQCAHTQFLSYEGTVRTTMCSCTPEVSVWPPVTDITRDSSWSTPVLSLCVAPSAGSWPPQCCRMCLAGTVTLLNWPPKHY